MSTESQARESYIAPAPLLGAGAALADNDATREIYSRQRAAITLAAERTGKSPLEVEEVVQLWLAAMRGTIG